MKTIAAYLLVQLSGATPTADSVTAVIAASGGEADAAQVELLLSEMAGKNADEVYSAGMAALKNVPMGGGGGGGAAAAGGDAAPAAAEAVVEEEEIDMGGGLDMFGGEPGGGGDY